MAGFTDLVAKAQPALVGGGCKGAGTEGATWLWRFTGVVDNDNANINLTGVTGTCTVYDATGATVTTLTFAGAADGSFTLSKDESATAGLAGSGVPSAKARVCKWALTLSNGTDVVQVWVANNSPFYIFQS